MKVRTEEGIVEDIEEGILVCKELGSKQAVGSKLVVGNKLVLDSKLACMVVGSKDRGRSSSLST